MLLPKLHLSQALGLPFVLVLRVEASISGFSSRMWTMFLMEGHVRGKSRERVVIVKTTMATPQLGMNS